MVRGWFGVQLQEITPDIARGFGLPKPEGVLVADVTPGSPAAKAGIRQGDIILAFRGHDVAKPRDLSVSVAEAPVGKTAAVTLWRGDRSIVLEAVIAEKPEPAPSPRPAVPEQPKTMSSMGLRLAPLTDELRRELRLPTTIKGVVVMGVSEDSLLADTGLERGDVIEEINRQAVTTPQSAAARLKEALSAKDQTVLMLINRRGTSRYLAFTARLGGNFD